MNSTANSPIPMQNETQIDVSQLVATAANAVAPVWPLQTFIAVNPLQGLEDLPFEEAVLESARLRQIDENGDIGRAAVNAELIKWCTVFFDNGQASIPMPNRHLGFYRSFADLARYDNRLNRSKSDDLFLGTLPHSPAEAISLCLDRLSIPDERREEFLRQSLAALPGWSGFVKWKEQWQSPEENAKRPAALADLAAVRLVLTCLLWPDAACVEVSEVSVPPFVQALTAAEASYRESLLTQLLPHVKQRLAGTPTRPKAQLVFCIDVRSEPFRRAIEAQDAYETLGFAGFFGVPVRVKGYDDGEAHDSCPVLLKPGCEVPEKLCASHSHLARRHETGRNLLKLPKLFYESLKYNFTTPFSLVEMLGPWCGAWMLAKTFAPELSGRLKKWAMAKIAPEVEVTPALDSISPNQQADFGEQALRMMGLTSNLAPLVVLCGHGSTADNNAFATSLDCGACGGNHGGPNARILAAILNGDIIRSILAARGLLIPSETFFIAAEHDTTTDKVKLFNVADLPPEHTSAVSKLEEDLAKARETNAASRCKAFGLTALSHAGAVPATSQRSRDWAQVRPEWGLARNAAFIVGPREMTRDIDLEGRCFLHSYDWSSDTTGKYLTTILTAPMVVAQWINSQYLFSTVDNAAYGAGSKVTQNVTGKIGVMQGNASDLMHGLPLQSVNSSDDTPYHEPLRLLTVVYAPRASVDSIIRNQEVLQKLCGNGWVSLACVDPTDNRVYSLTQDITWQLAA